MSDNSLVCKDLVKAYGHNEVLHRVNLEIEKGKIYGFIGRNGAGKTTLLSVASGQNPATSGEITVNGMPVWENQDARDLICFSRELNPMNGNGANTTKVKDYLKVAAIYMPRFDKAYADELVKSFGLDTKKRISKLSKGMMSMVTIIVALASKADYTFLDEPVGNLNGDIHVTASVRTKIYDEALHPLRLQIIHCFVELVRGIVLEIRDDNVSDLILEHLMFDTYRIDLITLYIEIDDVVLAFSSGADLYFGSLRTAQF